MSSSFSVRRLIAILALVAASLCSSAAEALIVRIRTTSGNIDLRLYETATPLHVANFLQYLNSNRYDNTFIHRSAKHQNGEDFVIQGGGYRILSSLYNEPIPSGWEHIPIFSTVTNEPGISNLRGTIALAKGSGVSSGTSEWFINLNDDNTFLNQGPPTSNLFTVFGRVILNGMTVADSIAHLPRINVSDSGVAFNEVPVLDVDKVIAQQDVFPADVVRVEDVFVRTSLPAADYNFDAQVTLADYGVWKSTFGSTTNAAADGNGNGIVDSADYVLWRNAFVLPGAGSGSLLGIVPEPGSATLLLLAAMFLSNVRRRRSE